VSVVANSCVLGERDVDAHGAGGLARSVLASAVRAGMTWTTLMLGVAFAVAGVTLARGAGRTARSVVTPASGGQAGVLPRVPVYEDAPFHGKGLQVRPPAPCTLMLTVPLVDFRDVWERQLRKVSYGRGEVVAPVRVAVGHAYRHQSVGVRGEGQPAVGHASFAWLDARLLVNACRRKAEIGRARPRMRTGRIRRVRCSDRRK